MNGCAPGTVLLAAVSGGADSSALLAALDAVISSTNCGSMNRSSMNQRSSAAPAFELHCLHVDHGIRPAEESRGDADFVRELCAKLNVPCRVESVPPGKIAQTAKDKGAGIEAAARLYRYRALFREARRLTAGGTRPALIVTAHTRDDLLETVLMRILRGAGPAGLAGIPAKRGLLLRPLLALSRACVLSYLAEKNIPWREDSTNADTRFFRNRVRHCLIPLLDSAFPHWRKGLAAVQETQSLIAAFTGEEASRRVAWAPLDGAPLDGGLCTSAENFFAQPDIIREEALFLGIDRLCPRNSAVRRASLRTFSGGLVRALDAGQLRVRRCGERVTISAKKPEPAGRGFALLIKEPGLYTLKDMRIEVAGGDGGSETQGDFYALLPMVFRPACNSDCITAGGRKTAPGDAAKGRERERLVSVLDRLGVAAFTGGGKIFAKREFFADAARRGAENFYAVKIAMSHNTGGMNV